MEIRSYRRVFDLERRIYRIDRLRLNPAGVPVRGIVYFFALLLAMLLLSRAPLLALLADAVPWYLRDLVAPGLVATLLAVIRIDGRSFHLAARSMLRFRMRSSRLVRLGSAAAVAGAPLGSRWTPPPVLMLPDGSEATMRRFRYTGPGAVRLNGRCAHEGSSGALARFGRGAHVLVRPSPDAEPRSEVIVLERDTCLEVR